MKTTNLIGQTKSRDSTLSMFEDQHHVFLSNLLTINDNLFIIVLRCVGWIWCFTCVSLSYRNCSSVLLHAFIYYFWSTLSKYLHLAASAYKQKRWNVDYKNSSLLAWKYTALVWLRWLWIHLVNLFAWLIEPDVQDLCWTHQCQSLRLNNLTWCEEVLALTWIL